MARNWYERILRNLGVDPLVPASVADIKRMTRFRALEQEDGVDYEMDFQAALYELVEDGSLERISRPGMKDFYRLAIDEVWDS